MQLPQVLSFLYGVTFCFELSLLIKILKYNLDREQKKLNFKLVEKLVLALLNGSDSMIL